MVELFVDRVLVKNNRNHDELETGEEIAIRLQNRILMLFFGSAACERCQQFAPKLSDFFTRLTDEFYVDRSAQLVLLYISLDRLEEHQANFLKMLPKKCLFLAYDDLYRRELEDMFNVKELPTVVVLRPDCSVLMPNAVNEILCLGPGCYRNWQEAAELIDRNFMIAENFQEMSMRNFTDPLRRLKYKVEHNKKRNKKSGREDAEVGGKEGGGLPW
ncbi:nucleoredoxin-like protein 1 [Stigmatopora argus]